jgi:hypothetical protein
MFGGELIRRLETVFPQRNDFDEEMVVKFKHRVDAKVKNFGLKIKKDNNPIFCQNFKKFITQNKIVLKDKKLFMKHQHLVNYQMVHMQDN